MSSIFYSCILLIVWVTLIEPQQEKYNGVNTNSKDREIYRLIRNFTILRYVLQYLMILKAGMEGPNQTAQKRSLIRTFAVRISPKTSLREACPIVLVLKRRIRFTLIFLWIVFTGIPSNTT